ncbi:hypothetical protein Pcinc_007618 [Petrolisthes cinctipes]|uniref:Uncharacterized protein n=1 Tax=Petrolisthes cinctipes TaxID=88211 RepID=A0AAE1KWQ3_PETCI|nr:hypothetical protein Pcinc_007618 [Petrolisthes cinctipes]
MNRECLTPSLPRRTAGDPASLHILGLSSKHIEERNLRYELLNIPEPPQLKRIIPGAVLTLHAPTKDLQEAAPICNKDSHGNLEGVTVTSEISPEQRNLPEAAPNCKSSSSLLRKGKKKCFGEISVVANEAPLQMGEDIAELHRKIGNLQCQLDMEKREKENILGEMENILKEKKACEELVIQLRKELNIAYIKEWNRANLSVIAFRVVETMEVEYLEWSRLSRVDNSIASS